MSSVTPLSVKQLNTYVKAVLENDRNLRSLWIRGELSNFVRNAKSGHCYFSVKDPDAAVKAVMFRSYAARLDFVPADGMQVMLHGTVSLYERDGQYQFYADQMVSDGMGKAYLEFLRLKKLLEEDGLFDRKKPLPAYPKTVGVCTSLTGAALQDIRSVCRRLSPSLNLCIYPCLMQGDGTVASVLEGLEYFRLRGVDSVIIARGGGSYEDLAVFNDELLARYVAEYPLPVISAIGHEIDFTILDFVSSARAATPSVAAELAVGQTPVLRERLIRVERSLFAGMDARLKWESRRLDGLSRRLDPERIFSDASQRLDLLSMRLDHAARFRADRMCADFSGLCARLNGLNPLSVLARGYAVAEKDGNTVRSSDDLVPGDRFVLRFKDGGVRCAAEGKE